MIFQQNLYKVKNNKTRIGTENGENGINNKEFDV